MLIHTSMQMEILTDLICMHIVRIILLFCEIKFHGENLNNLIPFIRERANPADINIFFTGEVKDPRPILNWLARVLYENDYE